MKTVLVAIVASIAAVPAMAEDHTAYWYQTHPKEMDAQIAACLNDPGHAKYVPNCENASQGQLNRDAADARAHFQATVAEGDAQQRQMWQQNPQALLNRLQLCNRTPSAAVRQIWDCGMAFGVAQQMTRSSTK